MTIPAKNMLLRHLRGVNVVAGEVAEDNRWRACRNTEIFMHGLKVAKRNLVGFVRVIDASEEKRLTF